MEYGKLFQLFVVHTEIDDETVTGRLLRAIVRAVRDRGYLNPLTYLPIATVAFVFSMFTIFGAGTDAAMWGFLLLLAGSPIYVWIQVRRVRPD